MPVSITIDGVTVLSGRFPLLRGVRLQVSAAEVICIGGRSGAGKSTLLECIAGLRVPDSGRILWDGIDIATFSRSELLLQRQKLGYLFQQHALLASYSVFDNIALPLRTVGMLSERKVFARVRAIMEEVALFGVDTLFPETLSAGQKKRTALARALVTNPDLLLLDEPVSGVDNQTAEGIRAIIMQVQLQRKQTVVLVSHDITQWDGMQARRVVLDSGKLVDVVTTGTNNNRVHV